MQLPHIAARLYGTPLLINRPKLDVILSVLGERIDWQGADLANGAMPSRAIGMGSIRNAPAGIAIIPVQGTLVKRALGIEAASGLTSYSDIHAILDAAMQDPNVRGILLDVDSPGGETGGVFELADAIRKAAASKPIWAVANDNAFSAAYAIASSASRLIVTRTGGVGSIGVVAMHVDQSAANSKNGITYTAITAGARKGDYSPHEPLSTEAQARLQTEVSRLYDIFVEHVAVMRNMDVSAVQATEAGIYFGPEGVAAGLVDAVMSFDEVLVEFSNFLTPRGRSRSPARAKSIAGCALANKESMMEIESTANEEGVIAADAVVPVAEATSMVAEARQEVIRDVQAISELCILAGVPDKAAGFIAAGQTEADVRKHLLTLKAAGQSPEIVSTIDPDKSAKVEAEANNPLIRAAKKLAA